MGETKHTPGPWERGMQGNEEVVLAPSQSPNKRVICRVEWPDDSLKQGANARLIAAAPELLAALKEVLASGEDANWDKVRAAIAKAEGRS